MSSLARLIRQTMTIARRDFVATVFTPTFLLFLLAPLMFVAFGSVGAVGAASMGQSGESKARIVILAGGEQARAAIAIDRQLRDVFREHERPPRLIVEAPGANPEAQGRAIFERRNIDTYAVMYGPLQRPQILHSVNGTRSASYLAEVADQVLRAQRAGTLLQAIVPSIRKTADLVQEIAAASGEQQGGLAQINSAITQLAAVTQTNAAASEELSATSEEMSAQAAQLQALMQFFQTAGASLGGVRAPGARPAPVAVTCSRARPAGPIWTTASSSGRPSRTTTLRSRCIARSVTAESWLPRTHTYGVVRCRISST